MRVADGAMAHRGSGVGGGEAGLLGGSVGDSGAWG